MKTKANFITTLILTILISAFGFSQNTIEIDGIVMDDSNYPVPYANLKLTTKYKGTMTNEDGAFLFEILKSEVNDSLEISCMGYEATKIKISDYLNESEKIIRLKESIVELDEIKILAAGDYVQNALKNLKTTTIGKPHQLTMLYRRASSEEGKARFFVEHYMKILDKGPSVKDIISIEVLEGRKSADYRFFKKKEFRHSVIPMTIRNPIRQYLPMKKMTWKKIGDTSYDTEDVVIIEGRPPKGAHKFMANGQPFKLYIGVDTFSVYKIENEANNSLYVYKKNRDGKLYLAYHSRQWTSKEKITPELQRRLGKPEAKIAATYKHEVFVLDIETNRKKMRVRHQEEAMKTDMADLKVPYNANFWSTFVAPPDTNYFKGIKSELESNYGVPLEKQFLYSN
ncbi:carboxypeptidase-like regulatory domain-containing protein [Seonamhaeicola marinus]|uniref:Carboxypeptidase-like regulatory domain-containing protein n=1 Tax=Seonamhaeicola marinus TaxID=1912246 RepID=A0A5D0HKJ2_9FLAO|nr:carboxypeptidase-like regulatory domain-containing protein [Seonamhaeicola marinus]TYA69822.1 carboxypeptidase-like regulatory domain-containing protein [Seonamhaeicola marinus]